MSRHADILEEREASLRLPFAGSLMLHSGIAVLLTGFSWWTARNVTQWGSENALGGAIGVDVVNKIPLPSRSPVPNVVANDTDSSVPRKPAEKTREKLVPEDDNAVPLNPRRKPKTVAEEVAQAGKYVPVPSRPNQVYSTRGSAVSSPMYGKQGIGGVGIGDATVAGKGCGGYLELVRQRIQQRWDQQAVSAGIHVPVVVELQLLRNGTVRGAELTQGSRSSEIDFAAKRVIIESSPFPPFLPACEGSEAKIEVRFEPKR